MSGIRESARVRRPSGRRAPGRLLLGLALLTTAAAACEGGDQIVTIGGRPVITRLEVPSSVSPGNAMLVAVEALGSRGVNAITVRLSGAYSDQFVTPFNSVTDTARVTHAVTIPDTITGFSIRVEAFATGPDGTESRVETRTVNVLGLSGLHAAADALLERAQGDVRLGAARDFGASGAAAPPSSATPLAARPDARLRT